MELITALGINQTVTNQFVIFIITYLFLYFVAFKPYFLAYSKRLENTEGNQEASERILGEIEELHKEHESKAHKLNEEYRGIYDVQRNAALKEYDAITFEARKKAKEKIEESKLLIKKEVEKAQREISAQVPEVTHQIVVKLLN